MAGKYWGRFYLFKINDFVCREQLDSSGLYYYRNRYYDAKAGRFITRDPIGIRGGVNFYVYCDNNPVNFVDPWGLCASGNPIIDDLVVRVEKMDKAWGESFKPNAQDLEMYEQGGWIFEDNNGVHPNYGKFLEYLRKAKEKYNFLSPCLSIIESSLSLIVRNYPTKKNLRILLTRKIK